MSLCSMTGFARAGGSLGAFSWSWEIKSVNGRGLDIRCRFPPGMESVEQGARTLIKKNFSRGNFQLSLHLNRQNLDARVSINESVLEQMQVVIREVSQRMETTAPSPVEILSLRGILESSEPADSDEEKVEREAVLLASLKDAVENLISVRQTEGAHLQAVLLETVQEIKNLAQVARNCESTQGDSIRARLKAQVDEIMEAAPSLPEERIAQEVALLMVKADIREELDRLDAHAGAMEALLNSASPVGRQIDFLMQEFNREANTLCSKATHLELTRIGLDLKAVIDQAREQAQNIE